MPSNWRSDWPNKRTNTNALNNFKCHCEPEGCGNLTASPSRGGGRGWGGLLRRSAPRKDKLLFAFVLGTRNEGKTKYTFFFSHSSHLQPRTSNLFFFTVVFIIETCLNRAACGQNRGGSFLSSVCCPNETSCSHPFLEKFSEEGRHTWNRDALLEISPIDNRMEVMADGKEELFGKKRA